MVNETLFLSTIVLILVLVEHTLGDDLIGLVGLGIEVLILVLVEHTLGGFRSEPLEFKVAGLNPCFSGTYSRRKAKRLENDHARSLNPCFSGTYSRSTLPSRHK